MPTAYLVLLVANAIYGTSYVATRIVLHDVGPATLAVARLALGAMVIVPLAFLQRAPDRRLSRPDRWNVFWMGVLGFAAAFGFANWGMARSTATNAALLITVEPISLILLSPVFLGERLTRREREVMRVTVCCLGVLVLGIAVLVPASGWIGACWAGVAADVFGAAALSRHRIPMSSRARRAREVLA